MTTLNFPPLSSHTAIILNGERSCRKKLQQSWKNYQQIIVCDGAWQDVSQLLKITASTTKKIIVLGDGDSINKPPQNFIFIKEQDSTDFEKALQWIIKSRDIRIDNQIDIYWANGGEIDHTLGNLAISAKYAEKFTLHFYTDNQYYRYVKNNLQIFGAKEMTISFFPFPNVLIKQTQGLQYPMKNYSMQVNTQQSLRNYVETSPVNIQAEGEYFVFLTKYPL